MRRLLLLLIPILLGAAFYSHRIPPRKIDFAEMRREKIKIFYAKSPFFSKNLKTISETISKNLSEAETTLGTSLNGTLNVYLYNDWEEKGYHIRDIRIAHAEAKDNSIHCLMNERFDGVRERREYEVLLQQKYGNPGQDQWREYIATALGNVWNQKTLHQWGQFLLARELNPEFPELWNERGKVSIYVVHPWNALFAAFVREKFGLDQMMKLYRNQEAPQNYESLWKEYLNRLRPAAAMKRRPFKTEFQKGISYAYSNGFDSGYATTKSRQSLDLLKKNGVQWVAAIPYGFMRSWDTHKLHYAGHHIAGESDESMAALAMDAESRAMKVMMKPQIWIDHSSWPGRIDFPDDAAWQEWFDHYEEWIVHYAIVSELIGADLLCIGTELVQATTKYPDRWRHMIARIRKIYGGPLVYAANYGKEFESITFWGALDYMGLDNYYPVRKSPDEGPETMRVEFQKQKEKLYSIVRQHNKPLLFTEIGYMANEGAGTGAIESRFERYDENGQAEVFRLALETYWKEPWFAGMYWWKWFSDPTDRGRGADIHSPHGRPAEQVLREWYGRKR